MLLHFMKLLAFASYTECDDGVMGKAPGVLMEAWDLFSSADSAAMLATLIPPYCLHTYVNYIEVWKDSTRAEKGVDDGPKDSDHVELTEKGATADLEALAELGYGPKLMPIGEALADDQDPDQVPDQSQPGGDPGAPTRRRSRKK